MNILRILIAEDDPNFVEDYQTILDRTPHDVTYVGNGRLLLDVLTADSAFDLVITDNQMPEIYGLGALRRMRTTMGLVNIRVIVHSSDDNLASEFEDLDAIFVDKSRGIFAVFEDAEAKLNIKVR